MGGKSEGSYQPAAPVLLNCRARPRAAVAGLLGTKALKGPIQPADKPPKVLICGVEVSYSKEGDRMSDLSLTNEIGFAAAGLVLATFCMRSMKPLRRVAIASNVAFIAYAYLAGLAPVLLLHVVLLPVNVYRLTQLRRARVLNNGTRGGSGRPPFFDGLHGEDSGSHARSLCQRHVNGGPESARAGHFVHELSAERPHEVISMKCPPEFYTR